MPTQCLEVGGEPALADCDDRLRGLRGVGADYTMLFTVDGGRFFSGRVRGTHMEGSIDGVGCLYAFAGDRR
jgi:hypothetical protein